MHKFVSVGSSRPHLSVVLHDSDLFFKELMDKISNLTEKEFYNWLDNDYNFCYLAMWLHPQTSYPLFDPKAKLITIRKRSAFQFAITSMKHAWPNYKDLRSAMLIQYEPLFRVNSNYLFNQCCNKHDRDVLSGRYLSMKLPFYHENSMVTTYDLKMKRRQNQEVSKVIFRGNRMGYISESVKYELTPAQIFKSYRGFVPYGLCYAIDALETVIPSDLSKMCVLYLLHPEAQIDLRNNEVCRILDFKYPLFTKKRKQIYSYDDDNENDDDENDDNENENDDNNSKFYFPFSIHQ